MIMWHQWYWIIRVCVRVYIHRLSKELQQKDKIIESLHTKLQQRPDTPSSSHAPSETTDQSDHTSFVSDERASINEDLELCSDVDAVSEYAQEEPVPRSNDTGMWTHTLTHTGTHRRTIGTNMHTHMQLSKPTHML